MPGADSIANVVFMQCSGLLVPHLGLIYRAMFTLKTYPKRWKVSNMVVLRKLSKPNYMLSNVHRPIALLNMIAKILSACVVEDLVQMAELHGVLPDNHFGCRPGRTTMDLLHYVTKYIKDAWMKNEVVSAVTSVVQVSQALLDCKGDHQSVVHSLIGLLC